MNWQDVLNALRCNILEYFISILEILSHMDAVVLILFLHTSFLLLLPATPVIRRDSLLMNRSTETRVFNELILRQRKDVL
ncbi:hypothetical protein T07_10589 [Trichinella nelsoni]|uniref:Uncharacterized protein n=1 Tax=Trichinella nelsoni TaxID=6336 RepID=A0A0V0SLM1_9BILA|nr:hypothetical protein T07_10589 [Trichinella nelsoni]